MSPNNRSTIHKNIPDTLMFPVIQPADHWTHVKNREGVLKNHYQNVMCPRCSTFRFKKLFVNGICPFCNKDNDRVNMHSKMKKNRKLDNEKAKRIKNRGNKRKSKKR